MKFFNFLNTPIKINAGVVVEDKCNAYTVINLGTSVATVNGITLNPGTPGTNNGESISLGGHEGEIFRGRIDISFVGAKGFVMVIQKIYLPDSFDNIFNIPK